MEFGGTQDDVAKIVRNVVPRTKDDENETSSKPWWCKVIIPIAPTKVA